MTVYRVNKNYLFLLFLILVAAGVFSWSMLYAGHNPKKLIIMVPVFIFVIYNLITFKFRRLEIEGDEVRLYTLYGRKKIHLSELEETAILKLKGRVMLILSDHEKFVFVSSFYENFTELLTYIRQGVSDTHKENIDKLNLKDVRKRILIMKGMMGALVLFFLGASAYNILS